MLNFKDFKKVAEDKKQVHMKHKDGHTIIIAVKSLPKIQQEALKRLPLAEGGEVGVHKSDMEVDRPSDKKEKGWAGESTAGRVYSQKDMRGDRAVKNAKGEHHRVLGEMKSMPNPKLQGLAKGGVAHYDDGGDVSSDNSGPQQAPPPPVVVNVGGIPGVGSAQPSAAAQQANAPLDVQQPNVPSTNPNVLLPNGSMSAPGAAQTAQEALQGQQKIDASASQAMVPVEQARLKAAQLNAQQDQDRYNALSAHADNLAANMKDIDPDAYRKNMSAPSKVATGIGLFLGGLSVPFHGHNFAQDFLTNQINNDIDAQKANNEKQKTIWGAYNSLYNNGQAASAMAKASMTDIYKDQAATIAQKLGTPQAMVNYQKLAAGLAVEKNKNILEASGNLASTPNSPQRAGAPQGNSPTAQVNNGTPNPNQDLIDSGVIKPSGVFGPDKAEAGEGSGDAGKNPIYKILAPDAMNKLHGSVQYGPPAAKADYPTVLDQFTKAQQAEKVLNGPKGDGRGGIHDLMQQMYKNTGSGSAVAGLPGHIRREVEGGLGAVPYVGAGLAAASGVIPKSEAQKEFESNKTVMETDLANALQGLVAPTDINKIVEANLPAYLDNPKEIESKTQKIINMVIKAAKTSQLEQYNMTSK